MVSSAPSDPDSDLHHPGFINFKLYLPMYFTSRESEEPGFIRSSDLMAFLHEACETFGGVTYSNPFASSPYRGLYKRQDGSGTIDADHVAQIIGLVADHEDDAGLEFFERWGRFFAGVLEQEAVLLTYHPIRAAFISA